MHEDLKSIGVDAAQSALNAGGLLVPMQTPFYSGGYSYTHVLHTAKGKSFRVAKQTAAQLRVAPERTALQCAARGCDGCKVCLPHNAGINRPPGGLVVDCFAGSGTTGAVARKTGRRAILIEKREAQCRAIVQRLAQRDLLTANAAGNRPAEGRSG